MNMVNLSLDVSKNAPTFESNGLSNGSVEIDMVQRNSRHPGQYTIMGSRQTFPNASAFWDALYLMSLKGRFWYYYKRNTSKHVCVVCTVNECQWKITCHAISASKVVQVHTFINEHNHSVDDVAASQPLVRSNRALVVIDDVICSTLDYQPRKICKDFILEHRMRLSYFQAWKMKETT